MGQLIEMIEFDSKLYLLDNAKKLTILDLYGSLINQRKTETHSICSSDNIFWELDSNRIVREERSTNSSFFSMLPPIPVLRFHVINNQFYFQEKNNIHIFEFVKKK